LAKLEHIKLEKELNDLRIEQKGLEKILGSKKTLEDLVVGEIENDAKTFGDKRRTRIEESEKTVIETPIIDEPVTVIFSKNGWVRVRNGWNVDGAALTFKEGDSLQTLIQCRTVDPIVLLDSKGRAYTVEVSLLPSSRGDGAPASSLVDVQDSAKIMYCIGGKPDSHVLVGTTGGYGFYTKISDMVSNRRAGREFLRVEEEETPFAPCVFEPGKKDYVVTLAEEPRMLAFELSELNYMSKGRGLILMGLEEKEKLVGAVVSSEKVVLVTGTLRGKEKELSISGAKFTHHVGHRARMGRVLPEKLKAPLSLSLPSRRENEE
jgi:topoisomerase IV subunit A